VPNGAANGAFRDQNLLTVPGGDNVVRLLPPLTVTDDEIRLAVERIRAGAATLVPGSGNGKA
jgi:acetylornithine/N-succinyldiaminopimelate aminotransferase